MTVTNQVNKVIFAGTGAQTVFAYTFRIFEDSDLVVKTIVITTGVEVTLVLNSDYTVTGAGGPSGGDVTLLIAAPPSTQEIVIQRVLPLTQETDYVENDDFPAESHEEALDRLTMIAQQINEVSNRALVISINTSGLIITLPPPEANSPIGWDPTATFLINNPALAISRFVGLDDTPSTMVGSALKLVRVNSGETALEFVALSGIDHDSLLGFVTNEHIDHSAVTLTAGTGLSGGGDLTASRTFNVTADYSIISANDGATNITGAELETLSDGSNADALHTHAAVGQSLDAAYNGGNAITVDTSAVTLNSSILNALLLNSIANGSHIRLTGDPTVASPVDGDLWWDGSALNFFDGIGTTDLLAAGTGAPTGASYVTLGLNGTLSAERVLTAGNGIGFVDTGSNGTLTVSADIKANSGIVIDGIEISLDLGASSITGTLAVSDGGTGVTTFADAGVLIGNGAGAVQVTSAGTAGQVLTSNGAGVDPTFQAAVGGGKVLQVAYVEDGALATGSTTIPKDNTIPQNTEGTEFLTLAITPTAASSDLYVKVSVFYSVAASGDWTGVALFKDSGANAIATGGHHSQGQAAQSVTFTHKIAAGSTSLQTFKVRIGFQTTSTVSFNGDGGVGRYGGTLSSSITITEISA